MCARILVVEDETLIRRGLVSMIRETQPAWEVFEASDGHEAIQKATQLHPDLILMDHYMRRLNGADAVRVIHDRFPEIKVIMVSGGLCEDILAQTLGTGVRGFVTKLASDEELMQAIYTVLNGRVHLTGETLEMVHKITEKKKRTLHSPDSPFSPRETTILELMAKGLTSRKIGAKLSISIRTVEHHRTNMLNRIGAHTSAELVNYALKEKFVS